MITCQSIKGSGSHYMDSHLSSNDYYEEGGKVSGEWFGKGAEMLGLAPGSEVTSEAFGAVGSNRHPGTGDKLTARDAAGRKSWTDIQLSCPKCVSVLAVLGGDERVRAEIKAATWEAAGELESFTSMRDRQDRATEHRHESRPTGNMVAAMYDHDTSREMDPQIHTHLVVANATHDEQTDSWRALAARDVMMASPYVTRAYISGLARRCEKLGYEVYDLTATDFKIRGVEHLEARFSTRTAKVDELAAEWEKEHGRPPSAKERAILVRDSRSDKLKETTTAQVRADQLAKLIPQEKRNLADLTAAAVASSTSSKATPSPAPLGSADLDKLLDAGIEHVTERASVGRTYEVLAAAVEALPRGVDLDPKALRARLDARASGTDADLHLRDGFRVTTAAVLAEEERCVDLALAGRSAHAFPLADLGKLDQQQATAERPLLPEQMAVARTLAASQDGTSVLIGDAGTGKTTLLQAVQAASGHKWTALAPTTGAASELRKNGFASAATMQSFLRDGKKQAAAAGGVVLVDEAGLIGAADLRALEEAAKRENFRLLLVGDTKQHSSITRGDALRGVLDASADRAAKRGEPGLVVARLSRVLRQEVKEDREISETLASGDFVAGVEMQEKAGHIKEESNEEKLIKEAAIYIVEQRRKAATPAPGSGKKPGIVVCVTPRWADAEKLASAIRPLLRESGELRGEDQQISVVEPLSLTAAQRRLESSYTPGVSVLTFQAKDETIGARPGENWLVEGKDKDGLLVSRLDRPNKDTPPQRIAWADLGAGVSVGRQKEIALAAGDSILLRAEARAGKKKIAPNGAVRTVERIGEDGRIHLREGGVLPATFRHYTHGYSVTSHKAQGASEAEAVLVMGQTACEGASRRGWYVGSTRHKTKVRCFVASLDAVKSALRKSDNRELAGEMVARPSGKAEPRKRGAGKPAAAVAAASPEPAPVQAKAAPDVAAASVPSPAPPEFSKEADASIVKRTVRIARGFFASGPMADTPPFVPATQQPKTESKMQEQENKPAKPRTGFRVSAPASIAVQEDVDIYVEREDRIGRTAHDAIQSGKLITYQDILDVRWNPYASYSPKMNEFALRHSRVELFGAKLAQDAELDRTGKTTPALTADREKHERTVRTMIAEDQSWLEDHAKEEVPAPASPAPSLNQPGDNVPAFRRKVEPHEAPATPAHTMGTPAEFAASKALAEGQPITYKEILAVSLDQLADADKLTPKQQEHALRSRRVEMWNTLRAQEKMVDASGASDQDKLDNLKEASELVAADGKWLTEHATDDYLPVADPERDSSGTEEIKWSRLPDVKLDLNSDGLEDGPEPSLVPRVPSPDPKTLVDAYLLPKEEPPSEGESLSL